MREQEFQESPGQTQTQQTIEQCVNQVRKKEVLEIYEDLLQTTWNHFMPILGQITMMEIGEHFLALTKESHPIIKHVQVTREGVSFTVLREQVGNEEYKVLRGALKELFANLIDVVTKTIFDILQTARH